MHSSNIVASNLPLPGISDLEPKTSRIGEAGASVKPPSSSLLQRLAGAITKRRVIQFMFIAGLVFVAFFGPPGWGAAISVLLGSFALIRSNEWPNEPVFSSPSEKHG